MWGCNLRIDYCLQFYKQSYQELGEQFQELAEYLNNAVQIKLTVINNIVVEGTESCF